MRPIGDILARVVPEPERRAATGYRPAAGDILESPDGKRFCHVDFIEDGEVYYAAGPGDVAQWGLYRRPVAEFTALADGARLLTRAEVSERRRRFRAPSAGAGVA